MLYKIIASENSKTEVLKPPTTFRPAHGSRSVTFSINDIVKKVKFEGNQFQPSRERRLFNALSLRV